MQFKKILWTNCLIVVTAMFFLTNLQEIQASSETMLYDTTIYCYYGKDLWVELPEKHQLSFNREMQRYVADGEHADRINSDCQQSVSEVLNMVGSSDPLPPLTIKARGTGTIDFYAYEVESALSGTGRTSRSSALSVSDAVAPMVEAVSEKLSGSDFAELSTDEAISWVLKLNTQRTKFGLVPGKRELYSRGQNTTGNNIRLFLDIDYFRQLDLSLKSAQDSIHIDIMDFADDPVGQAVANLLIKRKQAKPSLNIRVMMEYTCCVQEKCMRSFAEGIQNFNIGKVIQGVNPCNYAASASTIIEKLRSAGIEVFFKNGGDGIDHRKMVIVDGNYGLISGTCLSKPYFASEQFFEKYRDAINNLIMQGRWDLDELLKISDQDEDRQIVIPSTHDYLASIEGPAVKHLQASFIQSWLYQGHYFETAMSDHKLVDKYFPPVELAVEQTAGLVAVAASSIDAAVASSTLALPTGLNVRVTHTNSARGNEMREQMFAVMDAATKTLDMEFAYINPKEFVNKVIEVANRGVKISIVIPGKDKIDTAALWSYVRVNHQSLFLHKNIKVYEMYEFSHRKFMVADGRYTFFSTGQAEWTSWVYGKDEIFIVDSEEFAQGVQELVFSVDKLQENAALITPDLLRPLTAWEKIELEIVTMGMRAMLGGENESWETQEIAQTNLDKLQQEQQIAEAASAERKKVGVEEVDVEDELDNR
ncbi:MAG: phosphatidylserine/phosphatidylglycerophosphate/cardiolipin synthase family protein [Oligoflexia bacterium]|nr:phosphatidylserine/phosphatidylglycerophosphate/cardiolipin synthase family protein [Oligoflexia bacterium]